MTFIGVADAITWRRSWRLAVSAQCRSSSTSTSGARCDWAATSSAVPSNISSRSVSGSPTRSVSAPISGTRRADAARCADRNPANDFRVAVTHQGRDDLDPRLVRDADVLIRVAEHHDRPVGVRRSCGLGDERGLAHPGLTRHEHHLAPLRRLRARLRASASTSSSAPRPKNPNSASVAAPTSRPGNGTEPRPRRRLPHHLDRIHRLGQTLQLQRAELDERLGRVAAHHHPHDLGDEDLPALRRRAQPGGFDDRVAEVVVVLLDRLPGADPDPHTERLVRRRGCDARSPAASPPHPTAHGSATST